MIVKFPKNIKVDINNIPDDFEEQIQAAFADYTTGTSHDFTYQDKLAFIDQIVERLHKTYDEWDAVKDYLHGRFEYDLDNGSGIPDTSDYDGIEALQDVYRKGREDGRLYYQFEDDNGLRDHHVYDKVMLLEYMAIKAVIEWDGKERKE